LLVGQVGFVFKRFGGAGPIVHKILEIICPEGFRGLTEELLGFAGQFLFFFQEKIRDSEFSIQTLEYSLICRRFASVRV
jgi:hypothetical protein